MFIAQSARDRQSADDYKIRTVKSDWVRAYPKNSEKKTLKDGRTTQSVKEETQLDNRKTVQ